MIAKEKERQRLYAPIGREKEGELAILIGAEGTRIRISASRHRIDPKGRGGGGCLHVSEKYKKVRHPPKRNSKREDFFPEA